MRNGNRIIKPEEETKIKVKNQKLLNRNKNLGLSSSGILDMDQKSVNLRNSQWKCPRIKYKNVKGIEYSRTIN